MKQDDQYFFVGLVSFVFALFLIPFAVYLFLAALLEWNYPLPDFVIQLNLWIQVHFALEFRDALWWIVRLFAFPGFFFSALAFFSARRVARNVQINQYLRENEDQGSILKSKKERREFYTLLFKTIFLFMIVFLTLRVIEGVITMPS